MSRKTFRKIITSEEKIEQINPRNKKLIERFLRYMSPRSSDGTIRVYKSNFNIFFCWNLDNNDNKVLDINEIVDFVFFYNEKLYKMTKFGIEEV